MKKNILKATFVAAFALFAGYNVYNSQKAMEMSDLALANVEALANDGEAFCPDCKECTGHYYVCESDYDSFWNNMLRNCGGFSGYITFISGC
ncbi:NVEALA domain-containing protein [Phocaeicola sp.]